MTSASGALRRQVSRTAAVLAGLALAVGSCSGDDATPSADIADEEDRRTATTLPTTTEKSTTTTSEPTAGTVRDYFEALGSGRADRVQAAVDTSEPESPAWLYARYLLEVSRIDGSFPSQDVEVTGDSVTFCDVGSSDADACTEYTAFRMNEDEQLVTFAVDGTPLSERILGGGAPVTQGAVQIRRVVAYRSASSALFVVLEVKNTGSGMVRVLDYNAIYVGPDGRQLETALGTPAPEVKPGATAYTYIGFELAELGGTLTVPTSGEDFTPGAEFAIPVS